MTAHQGDSVAALQSALASAALPAMGHTTPAHLRSTAHVVSSRPRSMNSACRKRKPCSVRPLSRMPCAQREREIKSWRLESRLAGWEAGQMQALQLGSGQ